VFCYCLNVQESAYRKRNQLPNISISTPWGIQVEPARVSFKDLKNELLLKVLLPPICVLFFYPIFGNLFFILRKKLHLWTWCRCIPLIIDHFNQIETVFKIKDWKDRVKKYLQLNGMDIQILWLIVFAYNIGILLILLFYYLLKFLHWWLSLHFKFTKP
jgi:hypothetical protein